MPDVILSPVLTSGASIRISILSMKEAYARLVLKHGTPERRNTEILKPGTQNY